MMEFAFDWAATLARYREPRVLRTRAAGTPFRVRSDGQTLIVTTGSGNDRPVPRAEAAAAWPYIQRDAPKAAWKHLSNNTSYLEAVFDDVRDAQGSSGRDIERDIDEGLLRQQIKDLQERVAILLQERLELHHTEAEVLALEAERDRFAREGESLRSRVDELDQQLQELDEYRRKTYRSAKRVAALREELASDRDAAAAREDELKRQIEVLKAAIKAEPKRETELTVRFDLGSKTFGSNRRLPEELAGLLAEAAQSLVRDPDSTVTVCRRVLERSAKQIYLARRGAPAPQAFKDVMTDLHGDASIPTTDWHLMKQLFARASAIVHDGGADQEVALWIWLGTRAVAELVASAESLGPSSVTSASPP